MIKISRSNTNWLTKGEEAVESCQATEILKGFLGWLNKPAYRCNVYVGRRKITFTAIIIQPRNGSRSSMRFEGSVSEIQELAQLLPKSEKVKYHQNAKGAFLRGIGRSFG
ncbi:hypothetical protein A2833_01300 [Candidatus Azambacteria bacterium RIFCSPHIGHO2_01_FULL_44_55]|uniref:Uncharacterized protein n=1 Tax=Candidatus Azambacteria bacterium RIFCSPLOWO2_02_FULL_44_14 TaxID=1797306 RepID=A0A1F5C9S1_9BACT|nr:MAG: hypothetical protein A3A18_01870 [Candidatus Azambacteria bacterium RIFCSPLOWO2_01_FULL_44_84]OGD33150.1 MAG: hypothetical protein A3C78_02720 [Candidatus Azambacteria bacterium RIFCSPHIGHO2_02_FULL_45_18]OGD39605.1 MAG: hypothetical protein A3I30_03840 [Candidatus Azambacteria bacterium RIFCSPLOWO2_02_FULL_44_14]OGD39931.1 MAG: hypothetical protein A2833_01300 [Candidatus Azambacteria bacterium RIFCSPHIGHO2_01_FULL_44_55]